MSSCQMPCHPTTLAWGCRCRERDEMTLDVAQGDYSWAAGRCRPRRRTFGPSWDGQWKAWPVPWKRNSTGSTYPPRRARLIARCYVACESRSNRGNRWRCLAVPHSRVHVGDDGPDLAQSVVDRRDGSDGRIHDDEIVRNAAASGIGPALGVWEAQRDPAASTAQRAGDQGRLCRDTFPEQSCDQRRWMISA